MKNASDNKAATESMQSLLRGEISAIETYDQVLEKITQGAKNAALKQMRADHAQNRAKLESIVGSEGLQPAAGSGMWGGWAKLVTGTSKMIGEDSAIKALKEGEEHGLKSYAAALADPDLSADFRNEIENRLMPLQKTHIHDLDGMLTRSN